MRWALGALGILVTVAAGAYYYERFVARSPLRFIYLTGPIGEARYSELAGAPGWRKTSLQVQDGVRLNGLIRPPRSSQASWIVFYPGNDDHMLARGQSVLQALAGERDVGLVVFAYRGFDSSGGEPQLELLARDASAILEHVAALPGASHSRLHVVGFSLGGHLAVRAVGEAESAGRRVASLSLLAGAYDIVMVRRSRWPKLQLGDAVRTEPFLARLSARVLVVQGGADQALGGPEQGRAISRVLGERARYVEVEGAGHEALLSDERALSAVRDFIG